MGERLEVVWLLKEVHQGALPVMEVVESGGWQAIQRGNHELKFYDVVALLVRVRLVTPGFTLSAGLA